MKIRGRNLEWLVRKDLLGSEREIESLTLKYGMIMQDLLDFIDLHIEG